MYEKNGEMSSRAEGPRTDQDRGQTRVRNYIDRKNCVMRNEEMLKKRVLKEIQAYNVGCTLIFISKLVKKG
jgi:hypothetical protein